VLPSQSDEQRKKPAEEILDDGRFFSKNPPPPPERICGSDRPCVFHRHAPFKPPSQSIPCPTSGGIRPYRNLLQRTSIAGRERSNATGEQRHFLVRVEMNRVTSTRVETFSALLAIAFPSSGSVYLFLRSFSLYGATCRLGRNIIVTHSELLYRVHRDRTVLLHASDRTFSRAILLFIKKNDFLYCWGGPYSSISAMPLRERRK
jgi:hypothetical protein